MERIIDGILFEGKRIPDSWVVSTWEAAGHREVSVNQAIQWTEIAHDFCPVDYRSILSPERIAEWDAEDAAAALERKELSIKKAAQRAQTTCRRVIKAECFSELLTITYRENQEDRELAKAHFKEWVRRMKANLGGEFRYCASFEKQHRGAMHMHVACHKLPKHANHKGLKIEGWKLGTAVWRSIVGKDNGLVFVGGKKGSFKSAKQLKRSPAKMAAYVSKYIMKDYADCPDATNRYSRSNGLQLPKPHQITLHGCTLAEAISAAFQCADGDCIVSSRLGDFKDRYWLCTEPSPDIKKPG